MAAQISLCCMQFSSGPDINSYLKMKPHCRSVLLWEFAGQLQEEKDAWDLSVLVREKYVWMTIKSRLVHLGNYGYIGSAGSEVREQFLGDYVKKGQQA